MPATAHPFKLLLDQTPKLHHNGYLIWADNWFSGLPTIELVNSYGLEYGGTAKTNRLGGAFKDTKAHFDKKPRGSYRVVQTKLASGKTVACVQWLDSKVVTMLTTLPCDEVGVAQRSTGGLGRATPYTKAAVPCPLLFGQYNSGMGGTDLMDQMVTKYYRNTRYVWHVKMFMHLAHIALHNAHVSYKDLSNTKPVRLVFLRAVVAELNPNKPAPKACEEKEVRPNCGKHTPMTNERAKPGKGVTKGKGLGAGVAERDRNRTRCAVCNTRTSYNYWCDE